MYKQRRYTALFDLVKRARLLEIGADIYIRALAAAHGKDAHAVEVIDLTAHEIDVYKRQV